VFLLFGVCQVNFSNTAGFIEQFKEYVVLIPPSGESFDTDAEKGMAGPNLSLKFCLECRRRRFAYVQEWGR
jgi:hypothetical protein